MFAVADPLEMFAVMEFDGMPIYIGSLEECHEFVRLSGIVPLEGVIVPLDGESEESQQDVNGFYMNLI